MIAKIAVAAANFAIDKPYSYALPETMTVQPGMRVIVPFGRSNRPTEGIILALEEEIASGLKCIDRCLDTEPVLNETMLRLAAFLRERYFCTFFDAVRVMLPAGLWFQTKDIYCLTEDRTWQENSVRQKDAQKILQILDECAGSANAEVLKQAISDDEAFEKAIAYLLRKKWLSTQRNYQRRTSDKTQYIATLCVSAEEAMAYAARCPKSALMQRAVLEMLCAVGSASVKDIGYFTGAKSATIKRLAQMGFLELSETTLLRCREIIPTPLDGELILNAQQQEAFQGICAQMQEEKPGAALLYGITGSGKTSVYIQLIRRVLEQDKQAMLLVPEIALTPQLLGLLAAYFGQQVAVLHSSLSASERYDQWKRVHSGEAKVIVGTRSAVFAPAKNLGLIILDEEQEHSYKSENAPRYSAKEVALWRGAKENVLVLFGSATPSIETMFQARTGHYRLYTLTQRYNGKALPRVEIVDMREEMKMGNDLSLSNALQNAIRDTSDMGKQTILFLNRRGNSRALVCVQCRKAPQCPRCSANLTYHSANARLMCHYCGYTQTVPERCPECGGLLKRVGTGTQKVQQELQTYFPDLQVDRMDTDTVSAANPHEKVLAHFEEEKIPILVGTQMVAKGLNLPDVTLVGVLDADLGLYTDSYRAAETTFNMLTQVVGRAGRGQTPGRAVIQTMMPEHSVITLAAAQNYEGFYNQEIALRRIQKCPPFADMAEVIFTGLNEARVLHAASKFRESLESCLKLREYQEQNCTVLGPAPCPVPKINYNFRYRLSLRCAMTKPLRLLLAHLLRQCAQDRENRGVSVYIDVNGFD